MDTLLHSIIQSTKSHQEMHAMWVHFPIAASFLGLVLLVVLLLTGSRWGGMRWACVLIYALGAGAAYMALRTGSLAAGDVSTTVGDAAQKLLETHEEMGEKVWFFLLLTALLTAFTALRMSSVRAIMSVLALLAALTSAAWVGVTAHYGGAMVYDYGVGTRLTTPVRVHPKPAAPATQAATMPAATEPAEHALRPSGPSTVKSAVLPVDKGKGPAGPPATRP